MQHPATTAPTAPTAAEAARHGPTNVSRYQQELWMRFGAYRLPSVIRAIVPVVAAVAALVVPLFASAVRAAPVPVELKLTNLRAIQTFNLDKKGNDETYVLVTGTAPDGKAINERFPK